MPRGAKRGSPSKLDYFASPRVQRKRHRNDGEKSKSKSNRNKYVKAAHVSSLPKKHKERERSKATQKPDCQSLAEQQQSPVGRRLPIFHENDVNDRFMLGPVLGRGVAGVVYEGYDKVTRHLIAMKIIKKEGVELIKEGEDLVPLEASLQAQLNHKNVVKVHGVTYVGDNVGLVLERPVGFISLRDFFDGIWHTLDKPAIKRIFKGVLNAMIHCLDNKVFHQDLSMRNLLIHPRTLEIKLIDFGCADPLYQNGYYCISANRQATPPEYWKIDETVEELLATGHNTSELQNLLQKAGLRPVSAQKTCSWACGALLYNMLTRKWVCEVPGETSIDRSLIPKGFRRITNGLLCEDPELRMTLNEAKEILTSRHRR